MKARTGAGNERESELVCYAGDWGRGKADDVSVLGDAT